MQAINNLHQQANTLFILSAKKGDLLSMDLLKPLISHLSLSFFCDMLEIGSIPVCKYLIEHFDECLFYINHLSVYDPKASDPIKDSYTLLHLVYKKHRKLDLLEMLLQHKAKVDSPQSLLQTSKHLLFCYIEEGNKEAVALLLKYGVNPNQVNFSATLISNRGWRIDPRTTYTEKHVKQLNKFVRKSTFESEGINTPIVLAMLCRKPEIIELLLRHGAKIDRESGALMRCALGENYDPLSFELMQATFIYKKKPVKKPQPNLAIVKLLVEIGGADINTTYTGPNNTPLTALLSACVLLKFDLVKFYIELGADPNKQLFTGEISHTSALHYVFASILEKKKDALPIFDYLLNQNKTPISFITAALTFSYHLVIKPEVYHIEFSASQNKLDFDLKFSNLTYTPQFLLQFISRFDDAIIDGGLRQVEQEATRCFQKKHYADAIPFFVLCLVFGKNENMHGNLFNMACCYRMLSTRGDSFKRDALDFALKLFGYCSQYKPDSPIAKKAGAELEKLKRIVASSSGPSPSLSRS
jgi:ankyrin repeat protein